MSTVVQPNPAMKAILAIVAQGRPLTEEEAESAFEILMSGGCSHAQMGAFLMALRVRGETVEELTGGARVMRSRVVAMDAPPGALDTCGTGGDETGTFNISTAAALVTAACGVPTAKHGNRAVSSRSGAADVLAALGVNLDCDMALVRRSLWEVGFGFLLATRHHLAMKNVGPVRVELGTRTIFNLMGPLSNPAGTKRQLMGVFAEKWVEPAAHVLGRLGAERAWVVHGSDGLDEITTTGPTTVGELRGGSVHLFQVTPEDAGIPRAALKDLRGGDGAENARAVRALFDGAPGPFRDVVLLNAGAALVVADKAATLPDGVALARAAIDEGRAKKVLERLVAITNEAAS